MKFLPPTQQAEFRQMVWELVRQIPEGKVFTYGQIAAMIPPPHDMEAEDYGAWAPRWVGGAMAACPEDVPWQRVINSQGKISQRPGAQEQKLLLEEEGVLFDDRQRVDLKKYGWRGPEPAWLREHDMLLPGGV
jgi:methylated-DNA-protein-cysteine methyltransferase-like protein